MTVTTSKSIATSTGTSPSADRPLDDRRADYVSAHPQEDFVVPMLAREIDRLVSLAAAGVRSAGTVKALDIGCGRQPFRPKLQDAGFSYHSLDVIQNREGSVEFIAATDGELPAELVSAAPFELLLITEVMEHVADWDRAFANFRQLTATGSKVLITCPHFYKLHEEPYDFWRPTLHAIRYYGDRYGFGVLEANAEGDAWDLIGTMLASVRALAVDGSLYSRALAKAIRGGSRIAHRILTGSHLRRRVKLHGDVYLWNIALLERQA